MRFLHSEEDLLFVINLLYLASIRDNFLQRCVLIIKRFTLLLILKLGSPLFKLRSGFLLGLCFLTFKFRPFSIKSQLCVTLLDELLELDILVVGAGHTLSQISELV